jgi:cell division protein ZapA (FtsZ GTPase activity inhibitor)
MEEINITLTLCNRPFKLKTTSDAEVNLRTYIKKLNDNIDAYKKSIPGRDDFEYLAMATMNLVAELATKGSSNSDMELLEFIKKINKSLDY